MKKLLIIISILSGFSGYSIGPVRQSNHETRDNRIQAMAQQPIARPQRPIPDLVRPIARRPQELNGPHTQNLEQLIEQQRQNPRTAQEIQEQLRDFAFVDENGNRVSIQALLAQAQALSNEPNGLPENEEESDDNDLDSSSDNESDDDTVSHEFPPFYTQKN